MVDESMNIVYKLIQRNSMLFSILKKRYFLLCLVIISFKIEIWKCMNYVSNFFYKEYKYIHEEFDRELKVFCCFIDSGRMKPTIHTL